MNTDQAQSQVDEEVFELVSSICVHLWLNSPSVLGAPDVLGDLAH